MDLGVSPLSSTGRGAFENHASYGEHYRVFLHGFADVPYHWHREMEVLFVLKGGCRLVVDGVVCEMSAGDLMIINSDVPHNSTAMSRDAVICGVHLDVRHFERLGLPRFADRQYRCRTFLHGPSFQKRVRPMKTFIARLILDQTGHPEEAMTHSLSAQMLAAYIYRYIPPYRPNASSMFGNLT